MGVEFALLITISLGKLREFTGMMVNLIVGTNVKRLNCSG
jgi:hypothetical protein